MSSRLSRRRALGLGAAALAATGLPTRPPAALARRGPAAAAPSDFAMTVPGPGGSGASASRRRYVTDVLEAPRRFDLIGLRWRDAGDLHAEIRFRRGRRWSRWMDLGSIGEHAPDGERAPSATAPVWVGDARAFQLRLSRRPRGLRAHFVAAGRTAPPGASASHAGGSAASRRARRALAGDPPPFVARADWRAQGPRSGASYGEVKLAFVHHTVTANGYSRNESAAIVRSIQHYHRNVLGWNDVGYNALVDRYGQIFEGRSGGLDKAVLGAQAQGVNASSTGIAVMGTHEDLEATPATFEALAAFIAWKLSVHDVPPDGTVTVVSSGGGTSRFSAGARARFARISGHRDANGTACPGSSLYAQLPALRERVAELTGGGPLTLEASRARTGFRQPTDVSGQLAFADGSSPAGVPLRIETRTARGWRRHTETTTAADGTFFATVALPYSRSVRARFMGDGARGPVASRARRIEARADVTAELGRKRVAPGSRFVAKGLIKPRKTRQKLVAVLAKRDDDGRYRRYSRTPGVARRGRFRVGLEVFEPGDYRVTVRSGRDRLNALGKSEHLFIKAV